MDVDGVVVRPRHKYFSEKYSEEYGVPLTEIMPFFKGEYKKAAKGEVNIKDILPAYLSKWGWNGTVDDFLSYWFRGERTVDVNVLDVLRQLRREGKKVYLVSDNEKERANYVMTVVGLKDEFDGAFFSYEYGYTKDDPDFFQKIVDKLKVKPVDVDYWDDDPKNVAVAKSVGISAKVYTSFEVFQKHLSSS